MEMRLINQPNYDKNVLEQILINRGFKEDQIRNYLHLSDVDICEPVELGEQPILAGLAMLIKTIKALGRIFIVVDCDVDGYTSAALLSNYLYRLFPSYISSNKITYFMHAGKDHGLKDCFRTILNEHYDLVITPDSASNDYDQHKALKEAGIDVLVLDHHLSDHISQDAVVINNQLCDYPNKELSGVGVVWQFCRAFDDLLGTAFADEFLDLVALGLTGDMMSLKSYETRRLITKGFMKNSIKNGFIKGMIAKNNFSLTKPDYKTHNPDMAITPIGATFFIVPFVNAVTRSGTIQEKYLIFNSMLEWRQGILVNSTKRGHVAGEQETILDQALRVITNIKNRQTNAEDAAMEAIRKKIAENNLDSHGVIIIQAQPDEIQPEIRGLVANKVMAEYQKPCCVVSKVINEQGQEVLRGSMRGYTKTGIDSFKEICEASGQVEYVQGHDNAAGVSIKAENKQSFIKETDKLISSVTNISSGAVRRVDYIFNDYELDPFVVEQIAMLNDYWGQDIERAYIGVKIKVTPYNFTLMKNNAMKFSLGNGIQAIRFKGTDEEIEMFSLKEGFVEILAYCKCNLNEWNGMVNGQLLIQDYTVLTKMSYSF